MNARFILPVAAVSAMLILGCNDPIGYDPEFPEENEVRAVDRFVEAQAASGAVHDATLHAFHFDGDELNDLGRQKIDLMLSEPSAPAVVYVDLVEDDQATEARVEAVRRHFSDAGRPEGEIEARVGANPDGYAPAAASLAHMKKTDSDADGARDDQGYGPSIGGLNNSDE